VLICRLHFQSNPANKQFQVELDPQCYKQAPGRSLENLVLLLKTTPRVRRATIKLIPTV